MQIGDFRLIDRNDSRFRTLYFALCTLHFLFPGYGLPTPDELQSGDLRLTDHNGSRLPAPDSRLTSLRTRRAYDGRIINVDVDTVRA